MDRVEIEVKLSTDRAWLINTYAAMDAAEVERGVTASAHDASSMWTAKDHLVHLAGIEKNFNRMIERYIAGDQKPLGLTSNPDGSRRPLEQIMAEVNEMNEQWVERHRAKSLSEVIALGQAARAETLALLARLTDAQLAEKLPGAPWADGTIGGVLGTNAAHGRMHFAQVKEGREKQHKPA